MSQSSNDLIAAAVESAATLDLELLDGLLHQLAELGDSRAARRLLDRELPASTARTLEGVFDGDDYPAALMALETALRTAQEVRGRLGEATVVWSGPTVRSVAVRPTRQVVLELINRARSSLTLVTYVSFKIDDLVAALNEARLERDVAVRVVVETQEDSNRDNGPDAATAFKNEAKAVPFFKWPRANRGEHGGSMHVKAVVQDRHALLLSSANLTGAAFDRNMELGLLVEGGNLPERIDRHFDELIDAGELVQL